jgi:hypothetical protein
MPIDTSMYQSLPAPQQQQAAPQSSYLDTLGKAYSVAGMATQLQQQRAMKDAYSNNIDPNTGQLNQSSYLSDLGRVNPQAMVKMQTSMAESQKLQAEAMTAHLTAVGAQIDIANPRLQYVNSIEDPAARQVAFNKVMQQNKADGIPTTGAPQASDGTFVLDEPWLKQKLGEMAGAKQVIATHLQQTEIAEKQAQTTKAYSEVGQGPAKLNADLYGARSPNAELSSQYAKDAAPLKSSQMPMKQMMDNYAHPSPQGDASLVLNAFKIKFPTAPDVNSLEELAKSQATPDQWKQMANHAISGGLDQGTRDNLMRDGISTFRANYDSLNDVKDRYTARAQQQNVNDKSLTYEPAMDRTYKQAMALQDKVGPYVPPSDRGGFSGTMAQIAQKITGTGGPQAASAAQVIPKSQRTSDDMEALHWAQKNKGDSRAQKILQMHGEQ